jgi:hypothetical protein
LGGGGGSVGLVSGVVRGGGGDRGKK